MNTFESKPCARPKCFVLSPIGSKGSDTRAEADKVLKHLIRKSLGDRYEVTRGDEDTNPGSITSRIIAAILDADLIVADLSGHNANVFYEVAIAHGYRKPIVHIEREGEKPAFDLQDMRLVTFDISDPDSLEDAQETLSKYAESAISGSGEVKTPLSHSQQFLEYSKSEDPVESSMADLLGEIRSLRSEVIRNLAQRDEIGNSDADRRQFVTVINRLIERGAVRPEDFHGSIDVDTTSKFDGWVRGVVAKISGTDDEKAIKRITYDASVFEQGPDYGRGDFDKKP